MYIVFALLACGTSTDDSPAVPVPAPAPEVPPTEENADKSPKELRQEARQERKEARKEAQDDEEGDDDEDHSDRDAAGGRDDAEADAGAAETAAPSGGAGGTWSLGPQGSFLAVTVFNDSGTLAGGAGHDHILEARAFSGTLEWNPDKPEACRVSIDMPVSGLVVDPQGARKRGGIDPEGGVSDDKNQKILENAQGKKQLAMASFPDITYRSSGCTARDDGRVDVAGTLEIHGVGKALTVPMKIEPNEGGVRASGSFKAGATDFGFDPFSNLGGAMKNKNTMTFHVDLQGR